MRKISLCALGFSVVTLLASCSLLPDHRLDYQQAERGKPMQLPPGMKQIPSSQAYTLPDDGPLLPDDMKGRLKVMPPKQLAVIKQEQTHETDMSNVPAPDVHQVRSIMANDGNGYPMIMLKTHYAWAWEYIGDALKKADIEVTDKNREAGLYYIHLEDDGHGDDLEARIKLSHTTNGIQVVAMKEDGLALLDKTLGQILLARLYAEL